MVPLPKDKINLNPVDNCGMYAPNDHCVSQHKKALKPTALIDNMVNETMLFSNETFLISKSECVLFIRCFRFATTDQ
jgi:hypothetical protein